MEKVIKTNYKKEKYSYSLCSGEDRKGWTIKLKKDCRESNEEFFQRLINYGYTNIKFYEVATRIRGLHETIAYVKK